MTTPFKRHTLSYYTFISLAINLAISAALTSTAHAVTVTNTPVSTANTMAIDTEPSSLSTSFNEFTNPQEIQPDSKDWNWVDEQHEGTRRRLGNWANKMNAWFGKTDPRDPATASLRIIMDTRWVDDPVQGSDITVEPRIRGRLKLPVLEERLSLMIGDDDLDDESALKQDASGRAYYRDTSSQNKSIDRKRARENNSSIALRWSRLEEALGFDADVGIRSGDDVYVKFSTDKDLYENDKMKISNDSFYRYGSDSEHYARTGMDLRYGKNSERFINNRTTLHYANQDNDERTYWKNDLRQFHYFDNNKQLSYGISASGDFKDDHRSNHKKLNSYGPTISYRQPIWRHWLYLQTELNYYNDKAEDKGHYPSALLRMEALF